MGVASSRTSLRNRRPAVEEKEEEEEEDGKTRKESGCLRFRTRAASLLNLCLVRVF